MRTTIHSARVAETALLHRFDRLAQKGLAEKHANKMLKAYGFTHNILNNIGRIEELTIIDPRRTNNDSILKFNLRVKAAAEKIWKTKIARSPREYFSEGDLKRKIDIAKMDLMQIMINAVRRNISELSIEEKSDLLGRMDDINILHNRLNQVKKSI